LMNMDWVTRHEVFNAVVEHFPPKLINDFDTWFAPDELLVGSKTGTFRKSTRAIKLMNKRAHLVGKVVNVKPPKQKLITHYFTPKR
jgi:hypothetical protein